MHEFDGSAEATTPVWAVFGDLMAGLLGAFVLILVCVVGLQLDLTAQLDAEVKKRQQEEQRRSALEQALAIPLADGRVTLNNGRIGISGSVLFELGSDELQPEGLQLLKSLAPPLAAYLAARDEILMVSGFTDDRLVRGHSQGFTDNWELSALRSLTVTRSLIAHGVPSSAIFAAAFGSEQPLASNADPKGRALNRRVEITPVPRYSAKKAAAASAPLSAASAASAAPDPAMSETSSAPVEPEDLPRQVLAQVAAWRAQGAAVDPLACARLDALARRTACQQGATRALLEQRLSALLTAQQAQAARPVVAVPRGERSPSPLAALLASLSPTAELPNDPDRLAQPVDGGALAEPAAAPGDALSRPPEGSPTELKAVRYFRSTWQRLGVRQRLSQSQAQVPEKAGPLNTQRLLNQALQLMDEQAPDYLRHLVTQVEAWLWLEAASGMAPPERKAGKRG